MSRAPEYNTWAGMMARCFNPRATSFAYYGAQGITVCKDWCSILDGLLTWARALRVVLWIEKTRVEITSQPTGAGLTQNNNVTIEGCGHGLRARRTAASANRPNRCRRPSMICHSSEEARHVSTLWRSEMTTYLVTGFYRSNHEQTVHVVIDANEGLVEVDGKIFSDAFAAASALDPTNELCFFTSMNISETVPTELKNRVLLQSELYARVPELDHSTRMRKRRRRSA
jgi:hypothetical protein